MTEFELPPGISLARTLSDPRAPLRKVAWSLDGHTLAAACADGFAWVWDSRTGELLERLGGAPSGMRAVAFDRTGTLLATAPEDGPIRIWRVGTWGVLRQLDAGTSYDVEFGAGLELGRAGPDGAEVWNAEQQTPLLASVADGRIERSGVTFNYDGDITIMWHSGEVFVWRNGQFGSFRTPDATRALAAHPAGDRMVLAVGNSLTILTLDGGIVALIEGHTSVVSAVAYSADGSLIASRAADEARVWDGTDGTLLGVIPVRALGRNGGLAFHPHTDQLAVVGSPLGTQPDDATGDRQLHLFDLDRRRLSSTGVRYTSAKVVLVGDSGVGKTGLGWRLAHGEFKEHGSTHGQQFWTLDELRHERDDGAECEAVLWDLAGQPDYRLVHALFLDDADLALVLFDPTRDDDPLRGVEYWLKQLGSERRVVLVAARVDRGTARLTDAEIDAFCEARGVDGCIVTSAQSGEGLEELVERVRAMIRWDAKPATVTTETFKRIKDGVLALREDRTQRVIVTAAELRARLERDGDIGVFSDAEMLTAVGHLSNHGYVATLTTSNGESRVLLAPELLNNVAASIVLEARRSERSLGSLEEHRVLSNDYRFRELEALGRDDREVLLDSAVSMFLAHNVCFRETDPLSSRAYLVFPDLINLKKPAVADEHPLEDGVAYTVSGAVENVYASLVVLLGYTSTFTRTNQWRDQAQYLVGEGWICGFRLEPGLPGELEFVLYYGTDVGEPVRGLFQGLFESFLARRELSVRRYEPVACENGHRLNRAVVREQMDEGNDFVFCNRCGARLTLAGVETTIQMAKAAGTLLDEHRTAGARSRFEQVLFRLNAHVVQEAIAAPECFISYAWGDADQERWVVRLAEDLSKAGLRVILDRWENSKIGASVPRFVERVDSADRVLVIGTPAYRVKYENGEPMRSFVAAAEGDLIGKRMIGSEASKVTVLPLLLEGDSQSFPPLLHPRVYADFRDIDRYFETMLDLVLSVYEIDPREAVSVELRALLSSESGA